MLIVYWPITIKFKIRMQSSKPQPNYRCCLLFSYLLLAYFLQHNNIPWIFLVFMVLWVSHSNIIILLLLYHQTGKTGTPEIFLACYCVAIKKPIRHEKTKPQARMLISLFFLWLAHMSWSSLWLSDTINILEIFQVFTVIPVALSFYIHACHFLQLFL